MIGFLEKVHLHPDIADYVKELWMPGPCYSRKPNELLGSFPTQVIRLIEAEITRCIQPKYLDFYLKDGWQDSKCLSTVLVTTTMLFLLPNIKTLFCSGGNYHGGWPVESSQIWGAETMYKLIKRLQSHKKPECKILQKLERASIRWTTTSQETFEFLEWLAALPNIKFIQADGISTQVMHTPGRILAPRSSSLTKFEFHGQLRGTETLEGLLQAAGSLKCFVYHNSSDFEENARVPPNVGGRDICSLLSRYTASSLGKLKINLFLSVESLSMFRRLTHLCVPLDTLPNLELPGEISTALALPPNLEILILRYMGENDGIVKKFVRAVIDAKVARWPYLKILFLQYSALRYADQDFRKWAELATKDLAEVGVDFRFVDGYGDSLDGIHWRSLDYLF